MAGNLLDRIRALRKRIRVVYRRSSPALKCVVLVTIVLCTVTLIALSAQIAKEKERARELQLQADALSRENDTLTAHIASLGTVEGIRRIAREELDLVDPNTVIIKPVETTEP